MVLKGYQVLTTDNKSVFLSKLNTLVRYDVETKELTKIFQFPKDVTSLSSQLWKPFRRLFRKDIRCGVMLDQNRIVVVRNGVIYTIKVETGEVLSELKIPRGARPLNFLKLDGLKGFDQGLYFGEYFGNASKEEVRIFKCERDALKEVYCFDSGTINHIHNLVVDTERECIWILAGDFGDGASIYRAYDNFERVECVVKGKQLYRACVGFPVKEGLLYATDSQFEQNSIRLLTEKEGQWESVHVENINGPSIFGTSIDDSYYFSTSVEAINSGGVIKRFLRNKRGPGIIRNQSEIVSGNLKNGFKPIYVNKKDIFPFILFQFGNILFPSGTNRLKKIVFTPIALKENDFNTVIRDI